MLNKFMLIFNSIKNSRVTTIIDYILNVICNPFMWISINESDKNVDMVVNTLIQQYEEKKIQVNVDIHTIEFFLPNNKSIEVWTSNYPYAYGHLHRGRDCGLGDLLYGDKLPYRYTRLKLHRIVKKLKKEQKIRKLTNAKNLVENIKRVCDVRE